MLALFFRNIVQIFIDYFYFYCLVLLKCHPLKKIDKLVLIKSINLLFSWLFFEGKRHQTVLD